MTGGARIILGLMNFGPPGSNSRVEDLDIFRSILDVYQSHGYDEVDTARVYCQVNTKCPMRQAGAHRPEIVKEQLELSLKALDRTSVNVYYLHSPDRATSFHDTLPAIDQAFRDSKFKELGLSNFAAAEVAEVCTLCHLKGWVVPTVYQGAYNMINRTPEAELIPVLRRFGLRYVAFGPTAGTLLTGKIRTREDMDQSQRFALTSGLPGEVNRARYANKAMFDAIKIIADAGERSDIPMIEIAYRWIIHHSRLDFVAERSDAVLIGTSSADQLEHTLRSLSGAPLPDDVLVACDAAWDVIRGNSPQYFRGEYRYGYDTLAAVYH